MLNVLFLVLVILGVTGQNVVKKPYTSRVGDKGVYFFSMMVSLAALLFFLVTGGKMQWSVKILPYAAGFAVCYILGTVGSIKAIACGPLSLSSLVISYSLLLPAIYGLVFLQEPVSVGWLFGVALLAISLFLINGGGKGEKLTGRWAFWVLMGFLGNGLCSIVQKMQQEACEGAYKNEFMIAALAMVTVTMATLTLAKERASFSVCARAGWLSGLLCGLMNGLVNLLVMVLGGRMPVALSFPLISAGGILLTALASVLLYRERLSPRQLAAVATGTVSVVLMNL